MKMIYGCLLWFGGCASQMQQPLRTVAMQDRSEAIVHAPDVSLQKDPSDPNRWFIIYGPNFDPSQYTWFAQSSTDCVHWIDYPQIQGGDLIAPGPFSRVKGVR